VLRTSVPALLSRLKRDPEGTRALIDLAVISLEAERLADEDKRAMRDQTAQVTREMGRTVP
jgi:hypothetical protein